MFSYISSFFYAPNLDTVMGGLRSDKAYDNSTAVQQMLGLDNDKEVLTKMVNAGVIKLLLTILNKDETTEATKGNIISILANIAFSSDENKLKIVEEGGVPQFVTFLKEGSDNCKCYAAQAIQNLLVKDENVPIIMKEEGVVEHLVKLLSSPNAEAKKHAAGALMNISCDFNYSMQLSVAIDQLVALLQPSVTVITRGYVAGVLMNLADSPRMRVIIAKTTAVDGLVVLLNCGTATGKGRAAHTLFKLAVDHEEVQRRIVELHGIDLLEDISMNGGKSEKVHVVPLLELLKEKMVEKDIEARFEKDETGTDISLEGTKESMESVESEEEKPAEESVQQEVKVEAQAPETST